MDGSRLTKVAGAAALLLAAAVLAASLRGREPEPARRLEEVEVAVPAVSTRRPAAPAGGTPAVAEGEGRDGLARRNNEALTALDAGDLERAIGLLEACVEEAPEVEVFRRNLAEVLARAAAAERERERPCARCVERLERAVALVPDREDLARLLERWRTEDELERDFWRESSIHFDLAYDGFRTELLRGSHRLLDVLEEAYIDLGLYFGVHPVEARGRRFPVVLYERAGFGAVTGLGDWSGGAFDGTIRVPIEDLAREEAGLRRVLRHELVHAFVAEVGGPSVPGWLNEGLAQWLEGARAEGLAKASGALSGQPLFRLEDLEGSLAAWSDAGAIARAYAQSLALVDRIAHDYGEALLVEMVAGCRQGRRPAETFRERARLPLDTVLEDLAER